MSYLLDALRKAERERNLGRVPELSYAVNDSVSLAGRQVPVWVVLLVAGLVVLNIALVAAFWWVGQENTQHPPQIQAQKTQTAATPVPSPDTSTPTTTVPAEAAAVDSAPAPQASQPPPAKLPARNSGPVAQRPPAMGMEVDDAPNFKELSAAQQSQLPSLTINGHLFSSIPGRSFVLINGRRYNEGQRLSQGPAVVAIDEQGAILRMDDINYRLDAPR